MERGKSGLGVDTSALPVFDLDMHWFTAALGLALFLFALPKTLRLLKQSAKGRSGAAMMMLGLAFSAFLDPAKRTAIENIEKQKQRGREQSGRVGELVD